MGIRNWIDIVLRLKVFQDVADRTLNQSNRVEKLSKRSLRKEKQKPRINLLD